MARYQLVINNKDVVLPYIKHVMNVFPTSLGLRITFTKHCHVNQELLNAFIDKQRNYLSKYNEDYYKLVENKTLVLLHFFHDYDYNIKPKPIRRVEELWNYFRSNREFDNVNIDKAIKLFKPKLLDEDYPVKLNFLDDVVYNFKRTDEHVL